VAVARVAELQKSVRLPPARRWYRRRIGIRKPFLMMSSTTSAIAPITSARIHPKHPVGVILAVAEPPLLKARVKVRGVRKVVEVRLLARVASPPDREGRGARDLLVAMAVVVEMTLARIRRVAPDRNLLYRSSSR
jgi:hypothetical protein